MRFHPFLLAAAKKPAHLAEPKPATPPAPMVDKKYGTAGQIMALPAVRLVAILNDPAASEYARAKACQRLAVVGGGSAVPALAALLTDPRLSHYARFALEPNSDPAAGDALRAALKKVNGNLLAGLIDSLAQRHEIQAIPDLEKLRHHPDRSIAWAADSALARIRPPL